MRIFDQNSPERICEEDALRFLLAVFGVAALNLPDRSRFLANYRNLFGLGAKPGILLFDQALFARAWQFAPGVPAEGPDLSKKILVAIAAKDQFWLPLYFVGLNPSGELNRTMIRYAPIHGLQTSCAAWSPTVTVCKKSSASPQLCLSSSF